MPRNYKSKDCQTKPKLAGANNLPVEYVERQSATKDKDEYLEASTQLFRQAFERKKKGTNWSADDLADEIDKYFQYCVDTGLKPAKAGLVLWLGMSKSQYYAWAAEHQKYGVISELVNFANYVMENSYIQRGEKYPTMNIFLLKTSHGHVEASKLDITSNGQSISNPDEVKDLITKLGLDK